MLLRDDVIKMERQFSESLREMAILAAVPCPDPDGAVNSFVHLWI